MGELWGDNSLDMDDDDETSYLAPCSLNSLIQHEDSMDNLDSGTGDDLWDNGTTDDVNSVVQSPTTPGHDEGINSPSEESLNRYQSVEPDTQGQAQDIYDKILAGSINEASDLLQETDPRLIQKVCEETIMDNMNIMTWSANEGQMEIMKLLNELSVDLHRTDGGGQAPIHYAVRNGNVGLTDFLTHSDKAEQMEDNVQGCSRSVFVISEPELKTALHVAVEEGENVDVIELLVERGANVDAKDKSGNTPLHMAAKMGSVYLPEKLLELGADVNVQNNSGETALYLACRDGHAETAAVLTTHRADINLAQEQGWTPLHTACYNGHTVIIYQLLDVNADPFCLSDDCKMPINFACMNKLQSAVRRMLFRRGNSCEVHEVAPSVLFKIAQRATASEFEMFKDCIGELNGQNVFGQTALHYAAREGDLNALSALLSNGAKADMYDRNGNTPLHLALIHKHFEVTKALILQCANVNQANKKRETCLYLAVLSNNLDLIELLLQRDADVNSCNPSGESLVSVAVRTNNYMVLEKLLMYGANLHQETMHGLKPVHLAAKLGHTDICRLLVTRGCYVDTVENVVGRTPLHLAAEAGHLASVVELLSHGADVNATDTFSKKPLHLAAAEGHKDVVEVLLDTGTRVLLCDDSGSVEYDLASHQDIWDTIREWVYNNDPSAVPDTAPVLEAPPAYHALTFMNDM